MSAVPPAPTQPVRITCTPKTPTKGSTMEVCYDFPPEPPSQVIVEVKFFDALNQPTVVSIILTPTDPCATVNVPSDAERYVCEDTSGASSDVAGFVD